MSFGNRTFSWNSGRYLTQITDDGNIYSYKYDENGIRTSKTVNGVTTYYNTKDGVILSQSNGTDTMYFQYDTSGTPVGFVYNGTQYFYMTNQMGDVIAIVEQNGDIICEYSYDEWGKLIDINSDGAMGRPEQLAVIDANPLRYRGYYYDTETGYYYLQSRYYDPSICRFINADIPEIAQLSKNVAAGSNLFAYCNNDSVNNVDYSGFWPSYKYISNGFRVKISVSFLSRVYCLAYANYFLRYNYDSIRWFVKRYKNMTALRIAQELWAHALGYYCTRPLQRALKAINKPWAWLDDKVSRFSYADVNSDDKHAWIYACMWWSCSVVKSYMYYSGYRYFIIL